MGKLGDILKQDVGSVATKVLMADVGRIVKTAGRALNTDVGTIAKGASHVLSYDLADLFVNEVQNSTAAAALAGNTPGMVQHQFTDPTCAAKDGTKVATAGAPPAPSIATPSPSESRAPPARVKLTGALVDRNSRNMPGGVDLKVLLPTTVGAFTRLANAVNGDIASDPVSAIYSSDAEAITITIAVYWDADEARAQIQRRQSALENVRGSTDPNWVVGIDNLGVIFVWTRQHVCYEIVSPRGVSPLVRFLADFPY